MARPPTRRSSSRRRMQARPDVRIGTGIRTLAIDIGATRIKATLLNELGEPLTARTRRRTPNPATPEAVLDVIAELGDEHPGYDRISVGFPGVVHHGIVRVAP